MKLSTGNQINGKIMEIRKGAVTAIVYVASLLCVHRMRADHSQPAAALAHPMKDLPA